VDVYENGPRLRTLLVWLSGGALLVAMFADTIAMIGRQIHLPLIGSIEIVQTAILIASAGGLIVATLDNAHARVQLVLERLPSGWRRRVEQVHAVAAVLVYAGLLVGSGWIAADLWNGHEVSELLRIPYRPLRVAVAVTLVVLLVQALQRVWVRNRE
jgi:TRAP-type C4-dicarboxylate transport system permease small subunit